MATNPSLSHILSKSATQNVRTESFPSQLSEQGKDVFVEQFNLILSKLMASGEKDAKATMVSSQRTFEKQDTTPHTRSQEKISLHAKNDKDTRALQKEKADLASKENDVARKPSFDAHKKHDDKKVSSSVMPLTSNNTQEQDNVHDNTQKITPISGEEALKTYDSSDQENNLIILHGPVTLAIDPKKSVETDFLAASSEISIATQFEEISEGGPRTLQQRTSSLISESNFSTKPAASLSSFMDAGGDVGRTSLEKTVSFGDYGATVIGRSPNPQGVQPFPIFQMPMVMENDNAVESHESIPLNPISGLDPSMMEDSRKQISAENSFINDKTTVNAGMISAFEETPSPSVSGGMSHAISSVLQGNEDISMETMQGGETMGALRSTEVLRQSPALVKAPEVEDQTQNFQKIYTQIAQSLKDAKDLRNPTFHVHLKPEGLGDVYVQLSFDKQKVEATFNLSSVGFEALRHQKEAIASIFEAQGFQSGENGLQFSMNQDPKQFTQQQFAQQQAFSKGNYPMQDSSGGSSARVTQDRKISALNPHGTFLIDA